MFWIPLPSQLLTCTVSLTAQTAPKHLLGQASILCCLLQYQQLCSKVFTAGLSRPDCSWHCLQPRRSWKFGLLLSAGGCLCIITPQIFIFCCRCRERPHSLGHIIAKHCLYYYKEQFSLCQLYSLKSSNTYWPATAVKAKPYEKREDRKALPALCQTHAHEHRITTVTLETETRK